MKKNQKPINDAIKEKILKQAQSFVQPEPSNDSKLSSNSFHPPKKSISDELKDKVIKQAQSFVSGDSSNDSYPGRNTSSKRKS